MSLDHHTINILLIDEIEDDYYLIRHLLSECKANNYKIDLCPNLKTARKHLVENSYDIYLIDYELGETNGIELIKTARLSGLTNPAVLFTSIENDELDSSAIASGFSDFLPKLHLNSMLLERTLRFAIEKNNYLQEIKFRENELKSLLRFRELVTSISRKFIKGHGDTLDARVHSALGEIGEFLGVDRCRVYEVSETQNLKTYQVWSVTKFSEKRDSLVKLDQNYYPTLIEKLRSKKVVEINQSRKSNLWETEIYEFVKSIGIEHMLLVPLFFNGEWLGALSFESHLNLEEGIAKRALIELVSEILADVMERREKDNTLRRTREEALKVSQLKSEFLSNMSHELRTPLNAILGMTEVLKDSELNKDQQEYLKILMKSANSLKFIFDDIFEYAHLDSRSDEERISSFHFEDLVKAKILKYQSSCEGPVQMSYEIEDSLKSIGEGDQESLSSILDHLLSNSVKFTDKGEIKLIARKADNVSDVMNLQIIDSGIGIDERELEMVFDSFYQTDSTLTRSFSGTGLGLTIVRRMLDILKCEISIESKLNVGTEISFTFPFKTLDFVEQRHKIQG